MNDRLLDSLQLRGFLSFGPDSKPVKLEKLNLLIGPNGVGKSNLIEAVELLHATPTDLSSAIRLGGSAAEWLWKGIKQPKPAVICAQLSPTKSTRELCYRLAFTESANRLEITDEALEEAKKVSPDKKDVLLYYRFQHGRPVISVRQQVDDGPDGQYTERKLRRESIDPEQSILSQRKDPDLYPEITSVARRFERTQVFREWGFGRSAPLRLAQSANLPSDVLLPQLVNLGLVLNDLEHKDCWPRLNELMQQFLPRFKRVSTKISAGSVQVYLHEDGLNTPVPATRLSDGTLRFLSLLAILLNAGTAPLICIEEPELGLHPDAMTIIAELLVEAAEQTQLIVTSHSDMLVSALTEHADSVLVCDYLENGTEMQRLETEKLKFWLEKYRLGEVWRIGKLGGNLW